MLHNLALVGCHFEDKSPSSAEWYADASGGSGQALLEALEGFGLGAPPLLLWGFSAGGEFNYEFTCWRPDKVKVFVVNKGGFYYTALAPEAARQVPGIWFIGGADALFRRNILHGIFDMNNALGTNWIKNVEPVEHIVGGSEHASMQLFEEVLKDV